MSALLRISKTSFVQAVRVCPEVHAALSSLQLSIPFTKNDVKTRHRELVRQFHPDLPSAERDSKLREINIAVETLLSHEAQLNAMRAEPYTPPHRASQGPVIIAGIVAGFISFILSFYLWQGRTETQQKQRQIAASSASSDPVLASIRSLQKSNPAPVAPIPHTAASLAANAASESDTLGTGNTDAQVFKSPLSGALLGRDPVPLPSAEEALRAAEEDAALSADPSSILRQGASTGEKPLAYIPLTAASLKDVNAPRLAGSVTMQRTEVAALHAASRPFWKGYGHEQERASAVAAETFEQATEQHDGALLAAAQRRLAALDAADAARRESIERRFGGEASAASN